MKKLSKQIAALLCCVVLAGSCSSRPGDAMSDPLIAQQSLLDKDKFIEQSLARSSKDINYGPLVTAREDGLTRGSYHKQINKEESLDYMMKKTKDEKPAFPIDLNVENMDLRTFARMLSRTTGMNLLVSDEAGGLVTAQLNEVPWTNALDAVLQIKQLAKHVDTKSNIIRIHDQPTVMALEDFDKKRRQTQQEALLLAKASEPLYTEIFKLFYTRPDQMKAMLESVLGLGQNAPTSEALRSTMPQITVDSRTNMLIVKARKSDMELIGKVIEEVDGRTKQVFIEAFIVEVTDDFQYQLGTRLGLDGSDTFVGYDGKPVNVRAGGIAGPASSNVTLGDANASISNLPVNGSAFGGIGFLAGLGDAADLKVELTAMEAQGLTKVISNPRIFTLDNQEAIIFQGDEVPYETVSQEGTKIEFKEAGLRLAVTPSIVGDGNMMMAIQVNKDTVDTTQSNPPITKSEIKTNLVTKDGSTVVIGGIYTQDATSSKDQVPGLGDVPLIGKLFQRNAKEDNRRELMIFISPRVL